MPLSNWNSTSTLPVLVPVSVGARFAAAVWPSAKYGISISSRWPTTVSAIWPAELKLGVPLVTCDCDPLLAVGSFISAIRRPAVALVNSSTQCVP